MLVVRTMGRKKPGEDAPGQEGGREGKKREKEYKVKLSPLFHTRLKTLAAVKQKDMGELVEEVMHLFMVREWEHLTKRKWSDPD